MKNATIAFATALLVSSAGAVLADPVKLGLQPWLGYGPLWVAEEKGFFEANGLDVELANFSWDQDVTAALASGSLDVTVAATNTTIAIQNAGLPVKGFLILDVSFEADAILSGADIGSVADLKGKSIAFEAGSTSDLLLNDALRGAGLTIADVTHVPMGASEAGLALIAGQVDAAVTYEPYISAALAQGNGHKVLLTAAERPGLISDLMVATPEWLAANPDKALALVKAWDQAVTFIRENPEEGGAIIAKAVGSPMEEFTPAFSGVRLYTSAENLTALQGDFPATIGEIGAIMQAANPDEIKTIPTLDALIAMDAIKAAAGQ
ncbi:MAG: ABC transporter substrate-binding protein [Tabrizicola sp.]|nr:ABC transporter substrate-binding protein [Tabrizicola sp.]